MQRTLEPELLDSLPPDHPDALHNRRDLRLTNLMIGSHRWLIQTLPTLLHPGEVALEIGAGSGELGLRLAQQGVAIDGLDLWPRPVAWRSERSWHQTDLRTFTGYANYPVIVANLILHQFSNADLARLGEALRPTVRVIVTCEPLRRRMSQVLYQSFAPLFGANHVSLHDAHVSIAAGFRSDELPVILGLHPDQWRVRCSSTLLGVNRMLAVRIT